MVKFEIGSKQTTLFQKPFVISFETNNNTEVTLRKIEAFPKRKNLGNPRNKEEEDFQKLNVFRIDVFKRTIYVVEFFNLTATDSLDVNHKTKIHEDYH